MDLLEMQRKHKTLLDEAQGLIDKVRAENRALTAEEDQKVDALMGEADKLKGQIEDRRAQESREARLAAELAAAGTAPEPVAGRSAPAASGVQVGLDRTTNKPWASFGEFLQAVRNAAEPGTTPRDWDPRLEYRAPSGLSVMTPTDGGFLVQKDFAADLTTVGMSATTLASRCRRIPIGVNSNGLTLVTIDQTSRANGSRWGGVRAYWRAEADTVTETKPKLRQINMKLEALMALAYATDELLQDATALGNVIRTAFGEEFAFVLDDAVLNGDGAGKPLGITNAPALITVPKEVGQAANTIVVENIVKMWSRCHGRSRMNAVWLINQDIEPQLYTMSLAVGTGGVPVYMPAGGVSGQPFSTLFGRPVIPTEFNATLGAAGDIVLANLQDYLLIEKEALQVAESIHVRFLYGENTYRFMYRVNGQPAWHSALTPFKGSNTLSPYVALATRA